MKIKVLVHALRHNSHDLALGGFLVIMDMHFKGMNYDILYDWYLLW